MKTRSMSIFSSWSCTVTASGLIPGISHPTISSCGGRVVKARLQAAGPTRLQRHVECLGWGEEGKLTSRAMNMFGVQSESEATVPSKPMLLETVRIARVRG
jgi:hypothetical protein